MDAGILNPYIGFDISMIYSIKRRYRIDMYGRRSTRSIYGCKVAKRGCCNAEDLCKSDETISNLYDIVSILETIVDEFFPDENIAAPYIANMSACAYVTPPVLARIIWQRRHPGECFKKCPIQILQLKDIYLEYVLDPTGDPLFPNGIRQPRARGRRSRLL